MWLLREAILAMAAGDSSLDEFVEQLHREYLTRRDRPQGQDKHKGVLAIGPLVTVKEDAGLVHNIHSL